MSHEEKQNALSECSQLDLGQYITQHITVPKVLFQKTVGLSLFFLEYALLPIQEAASALTEWW